MDKEKMVNSLRNTVGYNESDHKGEFLKGAGMAIDKSVLIYEEVMGHKNRHIERLEDELESIKQTVSDFGDLIQRVGEER